MTQNAKTYELKISIPESDFEKSSNIKDQFQNWLISQGVESFVEGSIDDLDIDHRYEQSLDDYYEELGGEKAPLVIYDYSLEYLEDINGKILEQFPSFSTSISSMDSEVWMEGWKESFKPIYSEKFIVHPPWDVPSDPAGKSLIEIEPGMAFGTGQHATTQICLNAVENLMSSETGDRLLDVGTGTGVLAIAASKVGYKNIVATDIDHSAVKATLENAAENSVELVCKQESVPMDKDNDGNLVRYDVVVANILFVVLSKIIGDLSLVTRDGGLLILSGLLDEQCEKMIELANKEGMSLKSRTEKDGWICLQMVKK
jgi:ribosomal protein L11 methyltransferase